MIARQPNVTPGQVVGYFIAFDPLTGQRKWEVPLTDIPSSAGMLATGGGLVFTGKLTGEFVALDEDTGKTLWQFKTSSSVNATAITYTHKGKQYVSIASGLGGILARRVVGGKGADRRLAMDVRADAGVRRATRVSTASVTLPSRLAGEGSAGLPTNTVG